MISESVTDAPAIKAGQTYRVPKKLSKEARHRPRLNALGVWDSPGAKQVWMELRPGALLQVVDRARTHRGVLWRHVKSPDGVVDGFLPEASLQHCDLLTSPLKIKKDRINKPIHIAPQLFDWAYVGVDAKHIKANMGQCVAIEYDRLPDPNYLGLATFRMIDGRSRQAWLIHAQKTVPLEEIS